MSEKVVRIPVSDSKAIYGRLREIEGAPLIVIVHGLTGNMNEHLHYNGARQFQSQGYSVFRFNLYGGETDARRLVDCTTSLHAQDLDAVLRHLRTNLNAGPVIVVGHSLGGLTALLASEPLDFLVLWDCAQPTNSTSISNSEYIETLNLYRWKGGIDHLLSSAMLEERRQLDGDVLIAKHHVPVLIVASDEKGRIENARRYYENANEPKRLVVVPQSDHVFTVGETATILMDETMNWLKEMAPPIR